MDIKKLVQQLWKITDDIAILEKSVMYAFFKNASLDIADSSYFLKYFSDLNVDCRKKINSIINTFADTCPLDVYWLVEVFEHLIPLEQRKGKGVVYTPTDIKNYITSSTIVSKNIPYICDPACGCGSFLISVAEYMHCKYHITYSEIFGTYIVGVDIDRHAIKKAELLFNVLAYLNGETLEKKHQLICGDALDIAVFKSLSKLVPDGFDYIIGNPPYVRARNIW